MKRKKSDSVLFKKNTTLEELISYAKNEGFHEIYRVGLSPKLNSQTKEEFVDVKMRIKQDRLKQEEAK